MREVDLICNAGSMWVQQLNPAREKPTPGDPGPLLSVVD